MGFKVHTKCCCYECKERYVGCHSQCDKYKAFRETIPQGYNKSEADYQDYLHDSYRRWKNQRGLRKGLKRGKI